MPQQEPVDPFTAMAEASAQLHELFISYVRAGFTRPESLQLIAAILSSTVQQHLSNPKDDS